MLFILYRECVENSFGNPLLFFIVKKWKEEKILERAGISKGPTKTSNLVFRQSLSV